MTKILEIKCMKYYVSFHVFSYDPLIINSMIYDEETTFDGFKKLFCNYEHANKLAEYEWNYIISNIESMHPNDNFETIVSEINDINSETINGIHYRKENNKITVRSIL